MFGMIQILPLEVWDGSRIFEEFWSEFISQEKLVIHRERVYLTLLQEFRLEKIDGFGIFKYSIAMSFTDKTHNKILVLNAFIFGKFQLLPSEVWDGSRIFEEFWSEFLSQKKLASNDDHHEKRLGRNPKCNHDEQTFKEKTENKGKHRTESFS